MSHLYLTSHVLVVNYTPQEQLILPVHSPWCNPKGTDVIRGWTVIAHLQAVGPHTPVPVCLSCCHVA